MTFAGSILQIISMLLSFASFMIFAYVIIGWLFAFNILNPRGQIAGQIYGLLHGFTDPLLRPFRTLQYKLLPQFRQIDLSPIFAIIAIWWLQAYLIGSLLMPMIGFR
jgi:YggT family protein